MKQIIGVSLFLFLSSCSFVDLRTEHIIEQGISSIERENAIKLISEVQKAHGMEQWKTKTTTMLMLNDNWESTLAYIAGKEPWDNENLEFKLENNSFNGSIKFLSGDRKNETIGVQSWNTYEITDRLNQTDDAKTKFIIPALIYLTELPFRIDPSELLITTISDGEFNGENYKRLFFTWNNLEPSNEYDQYILWIDPKTYLVKIAEFTLRSEFKFVQGAMIYDNYSQMDGIQIPLKQTATTGLDPDYMNSYLHQLVIKSVKYDVFDVSELHQIKSIKMYKDEKPKTE